MSAPCRHTVLLTRDGTYVCRACAATFPSLAALAEASPVRVRRFEAGAIADLSSLRLWLAERGWVVGGTEGHLTIAEAGKPGKGRRTTTAGVLALVDRLRVADGLEPLKARS